MKIKPRITKVNYNVDGVMIDVNYRIIHAHNNLGNAELIILLPGWSINAEAKSAMEIAKAFSQVSNNKVLIIDTKPDKIVKDALYKEAKAVKNLILKLKPQKIIIAGYSEGGIKAVNLTILMQKITDIKIDGLVLMEPMGLYNQNSKQQVVGGFLKDSLINTPIAITKRVLLRKNPESIKNGVLAIGDVFSGFIKEVSRNKLNYPKRMMAQLDEMIYKSTRLKDIAVPVIIIQGINDPVSNPQKLIPDFEKLDEQTNYLERGSKNPLREKYLKDNIFKNSPYIRMLVGKIALPNHIMPFEDALRIARASIYLLKEATSTLTQ
jgi:pimeloyl-ACP methyl ester carboxylesterase